VKQTTDTYLIWSNEHMAWWRPNKCGYTTSIIAAGHYSKEEAIAICAYADPRANSSLDRETLPELPIRLSDIHALMQERTVL